MMNTTQWGRKETIIFPPHSPIYSYGAIFFALILTSIFVYLRFSYGQTPLQQFYTPIYAKSAAGGALNRKGKYQLLYVGDGAKFARLATESDVQEGVTAAPNGKHIPLALSAQATAQGLRILYRGPEQTFFDAPLHAYLRTAVFGGDQLRSIYAPPLLFGFLSLLAQLPFAIRKDIRRRKELKYGRRLKGPVLLTPKEFNKTVNGDGIGFVTTEAKEMMRIPLQAEAQHIELMGDTGAGKTTLIMQVLRQIQSRGHSAIVYDPACEFIQRFYDQKRGDLVLNPLDERCPYWGPSEELRRKAEAKAIAASLYQPTSDKKGEFFTETPQKIFAHLLTYGPNPQQLVEWLSNPAEIDQRVRGTEMEAMIAKGAQQQRNGVLASLGLVADSLRMLPTKEQAKNKTWSATEWAVERKGWIFITSSADRARGAEAAAQPLDRPARHAAADRAAGEPDSRLVRLGRTRQPAASPATPYGHHRKPEIQEPARSRIPGQGPVGSHLRTSCRGHALAARDQDIPENDGAESRRMGVERHRQDRDRAHEGDALRRLPFRQELHHRPSGRTLGHGL